MRKIFFLFALIFAQIGQGEVMSQQDRVKSAFTNLNAKNVDMLDQFYDESVHFEDPLGVHKGRESVKSYYANLYKNVTSIEFNFTDTISEGNKHLLVWTMSLKAKGLNSGKMVKVAGNSVIIFNEQDLVTYHRDYFDMGQFIYEHVPVLGWVIKNIKTQLRK